MLQNTKGPGRIAYGWEDPMNLIDLRLYSWRVSPT
jgi:hypothetical protein